MARTDQFRNAASACVSDGSNGRIADRPHIAKNAGVDLEEYAMTKTLRFAGLALAALCALAAANCGGSSSSSACNACVVDSAAIGSCCLG